MEASNTLLNQPTKLLWMSDKSINQVFAANLAALMGERGVNQTDLSATSTVSQKTVSNYLNPDQRTLGSKGKTPSAKLTELEMIAKALQVEPWQLLRPLNTDERAAYDLIEVAFKTLRPKPAAPEQAMPTRPLKVANGGNG